MIRISKPPRSLLLSAAIALPTPIANRTTSVTPIETSHGDFRDLDGLVKVAAKARRAGFRGMMAIHPDQVPVINRAFSPSEAELERAERIVAAFAAKPGAGTIGLDGAMLDMPHLKRAQAVLAMRRD